MRRNKKPTTNEPCHLCIVDVVLGLAAVSLFIATFFAVSLTAMLMILIGMIVEFFIMWWRRII